MNKRNKINQNNERLQKEDEARVFVPNEGCCSPEFTEGCIFYEIEQAEDHKV